MLPATSALPPSAASFRKDLSWSDSLAGVGGVRAQGRRRARAWRRRAGSAIWIAWGFLVGCLGRRGRGGGWRLTGNAHAPTAARGRPIGANMGHDPDRRRPFVHRSPGPRAAAHPGADGRLPGRRDGRGRVRRRRARLAAGRGDDAAGAARRRRPRCAARRPAGQPQLLLPRACPRPIPRARPRGARRCGRTSTSWASRPRRSRTARAGCRSARRPPPSSRSCAPRSSASTSACRPRRCSSACGARARRCGRRRRRWPRRAGWPRTASTRSSRRASRPAAIAACSCRRASPSTCAASCARCALLTGILEAVRVPVIAAGGIVDADGVAAALRLGASAVQVGTAFLLCAEATTSAVHRAALQSEAARAHGADQPVQRPPGARHRQPADARARAAQRRWRRRSRRPSTRSRRCARPPSRPGSGDFSPLWAGQDVSGCRAIPAAQLVRQLAAKL